MIMKKFRRNLVSWFAVLNSKPVSLKFGQSDGHFCKPAYTLTEIIIVLLVIAILVGVGITITKAKLDNIITYTYYSAYSVLRNVSRNMYSEFKSNDEMYIQTYSILENYKLANNIFSGVLNLFKSSAQAYFVVDTPPTMGYYACGKEIMTIPGEGRTITSNEVDGIIYVGDDSPPCNEVVYGVVPRTLDEASAACPNHVVSDLFYGAYNANLLEIGKATPYKCPGKYGGYYRTYAYPGLSTAEGCIYPCNDGDFYHGVEDSMSCGYYSEPHYDYNSCTYRYDGTESKSILGILVRNEPKPDPEPGDDEPSGSDVVVNCDVPDTISQQRAYCSHGYEGYDPTPGVCDYSVKPSHWPPACNAGYSWNYEEYDCKCVVEPRTLPRNGENFCKMFAGYVNTKGGSIECSGDAVPLNSEDFSGKEPDLILRNGMRLYNVRQNPREIAELSGNTDGGGYNGVANINSYGYTVYVDIDGDKGNSVLWEDVYPFYITMSGIVIPAYDNSHPGLSGGDSRNHLMVSVEHETIGANGSRNRYWLKKSVSFKEGACSTGYISAATPYCSGVPIELSCAGENGYSCNLKHIKPAKFLF